jgi:hypothetical protein
MALARWRSACTAEASGANASAQASTAPAWVAITVTGSIVWSALRGSSTPSLSRPPCTTSSQVVAGASAGGRGSASTMSRKSCGGMM